MEPIHHLSPFSQYGYGCGYVNSNGSVQDQAPGWAGEAGPLGAIQCAGTERG